MWPWGHLAVGYLLYSLGLRRLGRRPAAPEVFFVALGTQFSDLVDKPLAWDLSLLPAGRSLAHSLLVISVSLAILYVVLAPRIGRSPVIAFGVGWLSHPIADFPYGRVLAGEFEFLTYLIWPLLPPPRYEVEGSILAHFTGFELGPYQLFQFGLFVLAAYVWHLDGRPGLAAVRRAVSSRKADEPGR